MRNREKRERAHAQRTFPSSPEEDLDLDLVEEEAPLNFNLWPEEDDELLDLLCEEDDVALGAAEAADSFVSSTGLALREPGATSEASQETEWLRERLGR